MRPYKISDSWAIDLDTVSFIKPSSTGDDGTLVRLIDGTFLNIPYLSSGDRKRFIDVWTKPHYIGRIKIDSEPTPELKSLHEKANRVRSALYDVWMKENDQKFLDICTRKGFDSEYMKRHPMLYARITRDGATIDVQEIPHLEVTDWPYGYNWAALSISDNGVKYVAFYERKPLCDDDGITQWISGGTWTKVPDGWYVIHGDLDWKNSLVKRPEEKKE